MPDRSQRFIDALRELENNQTVDPIAELFSADAEVTNPHLDTPMTGSDGARKFWEEYRGAFQEITSQFLNTIDAGKVSALEWRSTGTLRPDGQSFNYGGVSIIEWSGDRIHRFATYFDPAALQTERGDASAHMHATDDAGRETPEHYGA